IEEDEIKARVSQHSHVVFIQRPGCANNGLPRLQKISDRIHAKQPPTSITCILDYAPVVAEIVGVVCQRHCTRNARMTKPPAGLHRGPRRGDIWEAYTLVGRLAHGPAEEREGVAASDFLDVRVGVPPLDQTTDDVLAIRG